MLSRLAVTITAVRSIAAAYGFVLLISADLVLSQPPPRLSESCDPGLKPTSGAAGYRERGGRCEGTYEYLVSLGSLDVVAFDRGLPPTPIPDPLALNWPRGPSDAPFRVRASIVRDPPFYRMDTVIASTSFLWPAQILAMFRPRGSELGVTVSQRRDPMPSLYFPVTFQTAPTISRPYRLVVLTPAELKEVQLTVLPPEVRTPAQHPIEDRPLRYGYYPARFPITIPIDLTGHPAGEYVIRLSAPARSGAAYSAEVHIYHAG